MEEKFVSLNMKENYWRAVCQHNKYNPRTGKMGELYNMQC